MYEIKKAYKELAVAVIERAIDDLSPKARDIKPNDIQSAKSFLDNSIMLDFYADIADIKHDMIRAGYLREER